MDATQHTQHTRAAVQLVNDRPNGEKKRQLCVLLRLPTFKHTSSSLLPPPALTMRLAVNIPFAARPLLAAGGTALAATAAAPHCAAYVAAVDRTAPQRFGKVGGGVIGVESRTGREEGSGRAGAPWAAIELRSERRGSRRVPALPPATQTQLSTHIIQPKRGHAPRGNAPCSPSSTFGPPPQVYDVDGLLAAQPHPLAARNLVITVIK